MIKDIVLAGLLHDVGKFAERAKPEDFSQFKDEDLARFNYPHAAATDRFLSKFVQFEGRQPPWFNYAAMHHKPSDNEPYQWMIAEADHLSSGMERASYAAEERESGKQAYKTPLKAVTEFIALKEAETIDGQYYLPLKALQVDEAVVFPRKTEEEPDLKTDYRTLFEAFASEFTRLLKYGIEHKIDTLYFLLQKYLWAVPSTLQKKDFPDISLFEHLKTTAALASCLLMYHRTHNTESNVQAIRNRREAKFLLFAGDIGGIQNFIYQISSKGAYSLLKGRSFYIQILSDIAALTLTQELGLTRVNIIYSSGGKFYLLLPNTPQVQNTLAAVTRRINEDLFERFDGELFMRTGWSPLTGEDLMLDNDRLSAIWRSVNAELNRQAQQPFLSLLQDPNKYAQIFGPQDWDMETCDACHKETKRQALKKSKDNRLLCPVCDHLERLGQRLKSAQYLVLARSYRASEKRDIFSGTSIFLHDTMDESWLSKLQNEDILLFLNKTDYEPWYSTKHFQSTTAREMQGAMNINTFQLGFQYYGGTRRLDATFDQIAERASGGFKKLAVLRMDVDNLGKIFSQGLRHYRVKPRPGQKERQNFYSLARLTTLSSQLNLFFSGFLNQLTEDSEQSKAAIVYAGGDDLFIVGAWDEVMDKALKIHQKFSEFTCHNPFFTLSGGLVITGGKFPIYKSAEYAAQAEEQAKKSGNKNAFSALGSCLSWSDWETIKQWKNRMLKELWDSDRQRWDRALINHLWRIVTEYQERYLSYQQKDFSAAQIRQLVRHERWLWRMVYDLTRFKKRNQKLSEMVDDLVENLAGPQRENAGQKPFIELLPALTQWVDYLTR